MQDMAHLGCRAYGRSLFRVLTTKICTSGMADVPGGTDCTLGGAVAACSLLLITDSYAGVCTEGSEQDLQPRFSYTEAISNRLYKHACSRQLVKRRSVCFPPSTG